MYSLEIIFWVFAFIVFYTYLGYGIVLYILVKIKELFHKPTPESTPTLLPEVTLLIAAYNEETIVADKMLNNRSLNYPKEKLKIVWVTDGTTDSTNSVLAEYDDVSVLFEAKREGKSAAINRAVPFISTPIIIFTDANTMLCRDAILEIVTEFTDEKVGCVAGEKRVEAADDATAGEGIYWKYESTLKALDYRLYSAVGAAGELFAIRTALYEKLTDDTLLDDFVMSLKIAMKGYKIAYCSKAYAIESGSATIAEEEKRKIRISAGGLQSIKRLAPLLNIFRYGCLSFQYISHRVLRWSVTPIFLFLLLPLNITLVCSGTIYQITLAAQLLIYGAAFHGKGKIGLICYYFMFMNISVIKAFFYFKKNKGGAWEKAKRK